MLPCVPMFPDVPIDCPKFNYEAFGPGLSSAAFSQTFVVVAIAL